MPNPSLAMPLIGLPGHSGEVYEGGKGWTFNLLDANGGMCISGGLFVSESAAAFGLAKAVNNGH